MTLSPTTPPEWHVAPHNAKSHLLNTLCVDVCVEVYSFLDANEHAACRLVCKFFCALFDHAFQRGYVACAIHCAYVEDVKTLYKDWGDPLRVAPVHQKNLFARKDVDWNTYKMQRSRKDKNATLVVNVAKMLAKGEMKLRDNFLCRAQFKAVHFIGTQTLEKIGYYCLEDAQNLVCFTMPTPCPKLKSVGGGWGLRFATFGSRSLVTVRGNWLGGCRSLRHVVLPANQTLGEETVKGMKQYVVMASDE